MLRKTSISANRAGHIIPQVGWSDLPTNGEPYSRDWPEFITAYASGHWDPASTPLPPCPSGDGPLRTSVFDTSFPIEQPAVITPTLIGSDLRMLGIKHTAGLSNSVSAHLSTQPAPLTLHLGSSSTRGMSPLSSQSPSIATRRVASASNTNFTTPPLLTSRPSAGGSQILSSAPSSDPPTQLENRVLDKITEGALLLPVEKASQNFGGSIEGNGGNTLSPNSVPPAAVPTHHAQMAPPMPDVDSATLSHSREYTRDTIGHSRMAPLPWGTPGPLTPRKAMRTPTPSSTTIPPPVHNDYFGDILTDTSSTSILRSADNYVELEVLPPPDVLASTETSQLVYSESLFKSLGYLVAPLPPDELARRKALSRFNVLYTASASDVNFYRIAHLAKIVFSSWMAVVNLVEEKYLWHKSEPGVTLSQTERGISFCAHSILQRSDEPFVILDTARDWRFSENPLVKGEPFIRFYAGAPLRTHDGHNIGTLCIWDAEPRAEFDARSRHTLKEFAAITMRELELWRDKIQLRIRDRIQQSMENFTRGCLETDPHVVSGDTAGERVDIIYQDAASLVRKTLDVDGALVFDVSHFEAMETYDVEGNRSTYYHGDLYDRSTSYGNAIEERATEFGPIPVLPVLGRDEDAPRIDPPHIYDGKGHSELSEFLSTCGEGKIYDEMPLPTCFAVVVPNNVRHTMIVPVFNVDKRPFLVLCAYTTRVSARDLEGFELQYLRAIGVIVLAAVLKQRVALADTAKALFISNISHELRTPLHGILASSEFLQDTRLTDAQGSYLKTVDACAQALSETVNHVLDFTKLSADARLKSKDRTGELKSLDLKQLMVETVEACWSSSTIFAAAASEDVSIVPKDQPRKVAEQRQHVEIITDIGYRKEGWWIKSNKGGIRRMLTNLIGNSLKFTEDGFVHVKLREFAPQSDSKRLGIEISVSDSGKGIGKHFLQNRIFQPFSQESTLQAGTGLGLAIVNSIAGSLGGKVDVWSAEGVGTEIRIMMQVEPLHEDQPIFPILSTQKRLAVALTGFKKHYSGARLLHEITIKYLKDWFGFNIVGDDIETPGDILVVNDDLDVIQNLTNTGRVARPVIFLSFAPGDAGVSAIIGDFNRSGGWCRLVRKPYGPLRLREALHAAVAELSSERENLGTQGDYESDQYVTAPESNNGSPDGDPLPRRIAPVTKAYSSMDDGRRVEVSPPAAPVPVGSVSHIPVSSSTAVAAEDLSAMPVSTLRNTAPDYKPIVLVIDDNIVNRKLLGFWLSKRGFEYKQACDGQEAVEVFSAQPAGFFDGMLHLMFNPNDLTAHFAPPVLLLDLTMPRMDGFQAAIEIRNIENSRNQLSQDMTTDTTSPQLPNRRSKIFALTGLASIEDKRKAFAAGVDGYLIKPVSLKTLDGLFKQLWNA